MESKLFSILTGASAVAVGLAFVSQPAEAFVITNTSGSWNNITVTDGSVIGIDGIAPSDVNKVKFLTANGTSQVRWGESVYQGHYEDNWQEVTESKQVKKTRQVPDRNSKGQIKYDKNGNIKYTTETYYETVTETKLVNNKIWIAPTYENQSGLGYKGVSDLNLGVGEIFNIGTLTHFNQTIWSGDYIGRSADFSLKLDFGDNSIGSQVFDFTFAIDETPNSQAVCPYQTDAGKGCSDKITWDFAINQKNSFAYNNEKYSLELVGFAESLASQNLVNNFISQEYADNSAGLFARLVKIDTKRDIPEPGSLLGLAGLGLFFAYSRRKQSDTLAL